MADTKIAAATSTTPASTDLIPMERPGSAVARQATVGAIVLSQTRVYNAVSYGAAAGADSTAAIQAAMDAAGAAGGGIVVIEPNASAYLLTIAGNSPIRVGHKYCLKFNYNNVWLEIRAGAILKLANAQQVDGAAVDMIVCQDKSNVRIYGGGRITGNTAGQAGWSGGYAQGDNGNIIDFDGTTGNGCFDVVFDGLMLDDHFSNPIYFNDHAATPIERRIRASNIYHDKLGEGMNFVGIDGIVVENLTAYDSTNTAIGDGLEFSHCVNVLANNLLIEGGFPGAALDPYGSSEIIVSNFIFKNTDYGPSLSHGIAIHNYNITFENGVIYNPGSYGFLIADDVHNVSLTNVIVYSAGAAGFGIPGAGVKIVGPISLFGCQAYGCAAGGLVMYGPVRGITINGCIFNDNTGSGISYSWGSLGAPNPTDTEDIVIANTICSGNSGYGLRFDDQSVASGQPVGVITGCVFEGNVTGDIYGDTAIAFKGMVFEGCSPNILSSVITTTRIPHGKILIPGGNLSTLYMPSRSQIVILRFIDVRTVIDKTQAGGADINLVGAVNLVSKAGDRLCLEYDETEDEWFELWRKVW